MPASFGFTAQQPVIGRLVATVDPDPSKWSSHTKKVLEDFYEQHLFFCPHLVELRKRAAEVHDVLDEEKYFTRNDDPYASTSFKYKRLAATTKEKPVSLRTLCKINAALEYIAKHKDENVRKVTMKRAKGRMEKLPLTLPDNSIVPSLYWANPKNIKDFREKKLGLSQGKAAKILTGSGETYEWFDYLENGETKKTRNFDFRVTKYFAQWFHSGLTKHCAQNGVTCPAPTHFFSDSVTAGAGGGAHTLALAVELNRLQP